MKQCLQETIPVVDVYKIKPFARNDTLQSKKYLFKAKYKIYLKLLIKAPEQHQNDIKWGLLGVGIERF